MFDISFGELALCLAVALVILGPERLPKVARTVGRWMGQARSYVRNFSAELQRETEVADLKRQLEEARAAVQDAESSMKKQSQSISQAVARDMDKKV